MAGFKIQRLQNSHNRTPLKIGITGPLWVQDEWKDSLLRFSFWALNLGLLAMVGLSLLPIGLLQTWASVAEGYWFARSSEFLYSPKMQTMKWTRALGDTVFALGAISLVLFVFGLVSGHSLKKERDALTGEPAST